MEIYEFGEFRVCAKERKLSRQTGEVVPLTPRVLDLLLALIKNNERVLTKDELLETVWVDCIVEESNLSQSVFMLRKALDETAHDPRFIRTIPHQGYRFIAPVRLETNGAGPILYLECTKKEQIERTQNTPNKKQKRPFNGRRWPVKVKNRATIALLALVVVISSVVVGARYFQRPTYPGGPLVVLPFENTTNDGQINFLSDGLAEDLTRSLGSANKLQIISYQSARQMRDIKNLAELRDRLHAGSAMRGRFEREGNRLLVSVELVNLNDGAVFWKDNLSSTSNDFLKIRNALTTIIANQFQTLTGKGTQLVLTDHGTRSNDAYLLYLQGKYGTDRTTKEGLHLAIPPLTRAIEMDPNYALAYVALAEVYNLLGTWHGEKPAYYQPLAKQTLEKALAIDDSLSEAHTILAKIRMDYDRDFSESEKEFRRAIELNPSNARAHHWYGEVFLSAMGRFDESLRELETARGLSPLSANIITGLAWTYIGKKEYERAVIECDAATLTDANDASSYSYKAMALMKMDKFDEAVVAARQEEQISGDKVDLGVIYGLSGQTAKAKEILQNLENEMPNGSVSNYDLAVIHAAIGERDMAFGLLKKQAVSKSVDLLSIRIDPLLDSIRDDARFAAIEAQMNLPPISK